MNLRRDLQRLDDSTLLCIATFGATRRRSRQPGLVLDAELRTDPRGEIFEEPDLWRTPAASCARRNMGRPQLFTLLSAWL